MTRYRTIVADPPWDIRRSVGGQAWSKGDHRQRLSLPYDVLSLDEIKALPVADLAYEDAHLYLWSIGPYLKASFDVATAWGFQPSITLVWCKPSGGFIGGTFYSNIEFILFCRRGSLKAQKKIASRWFEWPRNEHSAKPDAFLDMVEQVSPGPYVELFARRDRLGWDTWGDESLSTAELIA